MKVKKYLFESVFFSKVFKHLKNLYKNTKKINVFKILVPNVDIAEISDILRIFGLKHLSKEADGVILTAPQNRSYKVSSTGKDVTIEIWRL